MEPDCKISIITSTHIANTILPFFTRKMIKRHIGKTHIKENTQENQRESVGSRCDYHRT
jgi:hypothetical protein